MRATFQMAGLSSHHNFHVWHQVNRNIGVMFIKRTQRTRLAVKQALFTMYYSAEGRRAHDQLLFNDMFASAGVPTYCMPYEQDGLSCNVEYWGKHWPSDAIWNLHAACAPRGDNEKKANKKKWLIEYKVWLGD